MQGSAKRHWLCTATLVLALVLGASHALWALAIPPLKGRVNDYAGMLSASTTRQLEAVLADLERTDSTQLVVLTIPSLEGDNLEDFSIRVAEQWKIGQKGLDNGAVLLVSKGDRKIRIESGYGLEGRLTDLVAGRIIRNVIAPQFKMGHFDQGISDGVAAMISAVRGEFKAPQTSRRNAGSHGTPPSFMGLLALLFFLNVLGRLNRVTGAVAGGLLAPLAGALFFNLGLWGVLALIPLGIAGGLLVSLLGGPLSFGHVSSARRRGGYWGGGLGGGGFSSGGFGGFSGGGGGFGGGGASGGW